MSEAPCSRAGALGLLATQLSDARPTPRLRGPNHLYTGLRQGCLVEGLHGLLVHDFPKGVCNLHGQHAKQLLAWWTLPQALKDCLNDCRRLQTLCLMVAIERGHQRWLHGAVQVVWHQTAYFGGHLTVT